MHSLKIAMGPSLAVVLLTWLALATSAQPGGQAGLAVQQAGPAAVELSATETYSGGTRVKSIFLGVEFVVPAEMSMSWDSGEDAFWLTGKSYAGTLTIRTDLTPAEVRRFRCERLDCDRIGAAATSGAVQDRECVLSWVGPTRCVQAYCPQQRAGYVLDLQRVGTAQVENQVWLGIAREFHGSYSAAVIEPARKKDWVARLINQQVTSLDARSVLYGNGEIEIRSLQNHHPVRQSGTWRIEMDAWGSLLVVEPDPNTDQREAESGSVVYDSIRLAQDGERVLFDGEPLALQTPAELPRPYQHRPSAPPGTVRLLGGSRLVLQRSPESVPLEGKEITRGSVYKGPVRLKSELLGVSFELPEGLSGEYRENGLFHLVGTDRGLLGEVHLQTGMNSICTVADLLSRPFNATLPKARFTTTGSAQVEGNRATAEFESGIFRGKRVAQVGPADNCAIFWLATEGPGTDKVNAALESLADSARFANPKTDARTAEIHRLLTDKRLERTQDTYVNRGNILSVKATESFALAEGGTLRVDIKTAFATYFAVPSKSSFETTGAHLGEWRVEFTLDDPVLVLTADFFSVVLHGMSIMETTAHAVECALRLQIQGGTIAFDDPTLVLADDKDGN